MLKINKITSSNVVDYAAEELKKYLRMMMPEGGDIKIAYAPEAKSGFRLGLMEDFGLDVSDVEDTELDDLLYIDCDEAGGIIAGDNPRSVLLAVYEYLRQNGCRWLFPGVDGELIPIKNIAPTKLRHKPSCRFRGQCNEGATSQESQIASIEFMPKIGMNTFMIQFRNPIEFYNRYHGHLRNEENFAPAPVTLETSLQWKRVCETEVAKRGMFFHDVGHGFTIDPFGIDSSDAWNVVDESVIPDETRQYLAQLDGKRGLYKGRAINTQFCMSNPEARKIVAEHIADYSARHDNVDYLHVWLADASNNHCECENCKEKTPSDWYMVLMNDIDEALEKRGLQTKIVFIMYVDTIYGPKTERIKNPKRFSAMLAPIGKSFTKTLLKDDIIPEVTAENLFDVPRKYLPDVLGHFNFWRKSWRGACFVYEYYFWWHMAAEPSGTLLAKTIISDVLEYKSRALNGLVLCGSQRAYFPNGLAFYTTGRIMYDTSLTYEEIAKEYYEAAYGKDWKLFLEYFEALGEAADREYLEGERSKNPNVSVYYNPDYIKNIEKVEKLLCEGENLVSKHYNSDFRVQTVSVRLMERHVEFLRYFMDVLRYKCVGNDEEAISRFKELCKSFGRHEPEISLYYDHMAMTSYLKSVVTAKAKPKT